MINVEGKHFSLVSMSLQSEEFVVLQVKMKRVKSRKFTLVSCKQNASFYYMPHYLLAMSQKKVTPIQRGPEHILKQHQSHLHLQVRPGNKITHKRTHKMPKHPIVEDRSNVRRKVHSFNKYLFNIYYVLRQWMLRVQQQMKQCTMDLCSSGGDKQ